MSIHIRIVFFFFFFRKFVGYQKKALFKFQWITMRTNLMSKFVTKETIQLTVKLSIALSFGTTKIVDNSYLFFKLI